MQNFENTLKFLLSNSKLEREQGEKTLENMLGMRDCFKYFIYGLSLSKELARLSAILFRQKYLETNRFSQLSTLEQVEIKGYLFSLLSNDKSLVFLKDIGYILVIVCKVLNSSEDLIKFITEISQCIDLQEFVIYIIEVIINNYNSLIKVYENLIVSIL